MILTIIAFILVLGILVIAHEFGHFIAAKKSGVKVEEFAIGFPPRLFSIKRGETQYSINLFPIGGYVKMLGELEHSKSSRAFENQSPGKRFIISIAGVVMNLLLAWLILTIGFAIGMTPIISRPDSIPGKRLSSEIIIADVVKDSPAEKSGLEQGDVLISGSSGDSKTIFNTNEDLFNFTQSQMGKEVVVEYERGGSKIEKTVDVSNNSESPLGVAVINNQVIRVIWYMAPVVALRETGEIIGATFAFLKNFATEGFRSKEASDSVGGPVAIYVYTGLAVQAGIMVLMQFIALLSINLALINILPFPSLDGGRLLFILLEKIAGRRIVKEKIENIIHTVGFALLLILIAFITYKDILRFVK